MLTTTGLPGLHIHPLARSARLIVAALVSVLPVCTTQADTFGSGANEFTIEFVDIGNADNAADTTGYGAVPYAYRISKHEISHETLLTPGLANVTSGPWTGQQPAASVSWYEAAAFVNWLNTNSGYQAAYDLSFSNGAWSMQLWDSDDAWTAGGTNLYRHKNARYFLPSENEWYKAAYYNPSGANYFLYPTGSDTPPAKSMGTNAGTAWYGQESFNFNDLLLKMASVYLAGGLSSYGTMGQGGNIWEWNETAFDGVNDGSSDDRTVRGGYAFSEDAIDLLSSTRFGLFPSSKDLPGFRVASVPVATSVILTVEKSTNLSSGWEFTPITTSMITPSGELNVGALTNTNGFYRLKIRTAVE